MKGGWGFWGFIAILLVVHFALRLSFGLSDWAPDLLTIAVLLGARQLSGGRAAGYGFLLGLLEDGVSLAAFGAAAVTQTVIGYLGARSRDLFVGESLLFMTLYLFLGKWVRDALYYGVAVAARRSDPLGALLLQAPVAAVYSALAGVIAIVAYRSLTRSR